MGRTRKVNLSGFPVQLLESINSSRCNSTGTNITL
nr:MAG TPA: hypothetical protein [Caudoviricetes sp.]DAZ74242.1 MAG TPA: hypothetical protein [Caudoviricetes sp.]